jgi:hypothetical protein
VIFATAFAKAILVLANFMHLRFEPVLIYALVLIPLLFLAVLAAALCRTSCGIRWPAEPGSVLADGPRKLILGSHGDQPGIALIE